MMAKRRPSESGDEEVAALRQEVAALKDYVNVLIDSIEGLRDELQWITRNGLPVTPATEHMGILKRMALDPCADDWGEKLLIVRGPPAGAADLPDGLHGAPVLEETDAVEFVWEGEEQFGEIVSLDFARGEATVLLIPSHEQIVVPQNILTRVDCEEGDDENPDESPHDQAAMPPQLSAEEDPPAAPLDELITGPDSQGRLF